MKLGYLGTYPRQYADLPPLVEILLVKYISQSQLRGPVTCIVDNIHHLPGN